MGFQLLTGMLLALSVKGDSDPNGHPKGPAVGIGVGNLPPDQIDSVMRVAHAAGIRLVDTAAASNNEHLIAATNKELSPPMAVETKVWYTHLGYNRTVISVEKSLKALQVDKINIVLIHWPRCNDDIPWMNCAEEEAALPDDVKVAGPAPHLAGPDDEKPWIGSWRALEDMKTQGKVGAIGVSNFDVHELRELVNLATIRPHMLQNSVWSFFFDQELINEARKHGIFYQAYSVMNAFLPQFHSERFPHQSQEWARVISALGAVTGFGSAIVKEGFKLMNERELLIAYLTAEGVGVIPKSSNSEHITANAKAAGALDTLPRHLRNHLGLLLEEWLRATHGQPPRNPHPDEGDL